MALNKQALEDKISALLALDTPPNAENPEDCANKISDYVDEYLADLELNAFPAPGIQPTAPTPTPDPTGPAPKAEPKETLLAENFREELVRVMVDRSGDFSTCGPKFVEDMATVTDVSDAQSYEASGASVCPDSAHPDIDAAFNKGKEGLSHVEVAKELANQIHNATTSTVFTAAGPYAKAAFVQTPPTPPYTSPFK